MRCESCPVREGPCVGELAPTGLWLWACPAAARGEHLAEIRAASRPLAGRPAPAPPPPPRPPDPRPTRVAVPAPDLGAILEARSCGSRGGDPECGCPAKSRCLKYARDVSDGDCVACVAAGAWDPPTIEPAG